MADNLTKLKGNTVKMATPVLEWDDPKKGPKSEFSMLTHDTAGQGWIFTVIAELDKNGKPVLKIKRSKEKFIPLIEPVRF